MEPKTGISKTNMEAVTHLLNPILADEFVLYLKTRKAH